MQQHKTKRKYSHTFRGSHSKRQGIPKCICTNNQILVWLLDCAVPKQHSRPSQSGTGALYRPPHQETLAQYEEETHLPAKCYRWFPSLAYRTPSNHHGGGLGSHLDKMLSQPPVQCHQDFSKIISLVYPVRLGLVDMSGSQRVKMAAPCPPGRGALCDFSGLTKLHGKSDLQTSLSKCSGRTVLMLPRSSLAQLLEFQAMLPFTYLLLYYTKCTDKLTSPSPPRPTDLLIEWHFNFVLFTLCL